MKTGPVYGIWESAISASLVRWRGEKASDARNEPVGLP